MQMGPKKKKKTRLWADNSAANIQSITGARNCFLFSRVQSGSGGHHLHRSVEERTLKLTILSI
jgi:hypothetical protein